jgi:hypothetical protein
MRQDMAKRKSHQTVLTMVCNTRNYWVSGLVHRPVFYKTREHNVRKLDLFQSSS